MSIQTRFQFEPGSRRELLAALYPFVVVGLILPGINLLARSGIVLAPGWLVTAVMLTLLGLIGLLLIGGLAVGMPRWSLPYLGFAAALLSVYLFSFLIGGVFYILSSDIFDRSSLLGEIFLDGVFWFGLLMAMVLLIWGSTFSPKLRRFREDWTLPGFMLYGAIPFIIWLSFDEYVGAEFYKLLIFLVLAFGAWFYLRNADPQKRFWFLFFAWTVSLLMTAASKAILIPSQDWPITIDTGLILSEVKHTLIMGGWLVLIMLLPLLLKGLSVKDESLPAG